jgi:hypothetical protein
MGLLLLIILIAVLVGGLPTISHHGYGYAPSGFLGIVVIILIVFLLIGRL